MNTLRSDEQDALRNLIRENTEAIVRINRARAESGELPLNLIEAALTHAMHTALQVGLNIGLARERGN
jgi:hypothetical protein